MSVLRKRPGIFTNGNKENEEKKDEDSSKEIKRPPIISVKFEIYENIKALHESFTSFKLKDIYNLRIYLSKVLFTRERKTAVIPFEKEAWNVFVFVFILTLATRLYNIGVPRHIW